MKSRAPLREVKNAQSCSVAVVGNSSWLDGSNTENTNQDTENSPARDVQYFLDHPEERKLIFGQCKNNPGEVGDSAECVNVFAANKQALIQEMKQAVGN